MKSTGGAPACGHQQPFTTVSYAGTQLLGEHRRSCAMPLRVLYDAFAAISGNQAC
jgi:hypothetical protein